MIKFYYCDNKEQYQIAQTSGTITSEDIVIIKGSGTEGVLISKGVEIGNTLKTIDVTNGLDVLLGYHTPDDQGLYQLLQNNTIVGHFIYQGNTQYVLGKFEITDTGLIVGNIDNIYYRTVFDSMGLEWRTLIPYNTTLTFAGEYKYNNIETVELEQIDPDSKLYFIESLGVFGIGVVTAQTSTTDYCTPFKFTGMVSFTSEQAETLASSFPGSVAVHKHLNSILAPRVDYTYQITDRNGIFYKFTKAGDYTYRAMPLFQLKPGDAILNDGTYMLNEQALTKATEVREIIVDPIRKTAIIRNSSQGQVSAYTYYGSQLTTGSLFADNKYLTYIGDQLASCTNCEDYLHIALSPSKYFVKNVTQWKSYFPVYYPLTYGGTNAFDTRGLLCTEAEKEVIKNTDSIQNLINAMGATNIFVLSTNSIIPERRQYGSTSLDSNGIIKASVFYSYHADIYTSTPEESMLGDNVSNRKYNVMVLYK